MEALCSPKRRYISHTAYAIMSQKTQHRQHLTPHNLQFDTAECQLLSVSFYHSQSSWLLPRCCLLQTFCKKQHCNVATSSGLQPNYTIIALEQQKCQTLRQVAGWNFGPSCCHCIPFLPTHPHPLLSPPPPQSVKQYTSTSSVKPSGYLTCRSLSHPKQFYCSPTHCVCVLCIADTISSSHFSSELDDCPCNGGCESSL